MNSEILNLTNTVQQKQNDIQNLNVDKTLSEKGLSSIKNKVKQLEEINLNQEKEVLDLKFQLEKKN